MADDNDLKFSLDLDSKEFIEGAQKALETIKSLGELENVAGLLEGFAELGLALGAAGLAVYAFKEALDLTVEGEEIKRIESQFNTLSAQAGISGTALKEGMEKAAGGLISTNDLLKIANKSLVVMGSDAAKLPDILELARKTTLVFGGDAKTNFEQISQAIETGNQKMLRRLGINIDVTAAEQKFAAELGVTVGELDAAGKQHAIMNAVLEQGGKQFSGINLNQQRTVDILTEMKVAFHEVGETFTIVFSNTIGPTVQKAAGWFKDLAVSLKQFTLKHFAAEAKDATAAIPGLKKAVDDLHASDVHGANAAAAADTALMKQKFTNSENVKKEDLKVQQELEKLHTATLKAEQANITRLDQVDKILKAQKLQRERQHTAELQKIDQEYGKNTERALKLRTAENAKFKAEEAKSDRDEFTLKMNLLKTWQSNSTTVWEGVAREAKVKSMQIKHDLMDMGKTGQEIMSTLDNAGTAAFTALGKAAAQGSQNAAQAMGNALLGALGQFATQKGATVIASGVADLAMLNPMGTAEIVAGGALVALGAALNSLAGSSSSSPSVSTSPPSPGAAPSSGAQGGQTGSMTQAQQAPQRSVQVNISGHYLNTPAAQRTIMEMMRNETDATGFQYNSIGPR